MLRQKTENSINPNIEALIDFLKSAKKNLAKKDYKALEIDLTQALGRAKNLKIEEEDRRKEAHE